jgi:hypothetical protein
MPYRNWKQFCRLIPRGTHPNSSQPSLRSFRTWAREKEWGFRRGERKTSEFASASPLCRLSYRQSMSFAQRESCIRILAAIDPAIARAVFPDLLGESSIRRQLIHSQSVVAAICLFVYHYLEPRRGNQAECLVVPLEDKRAPQDSRVDPRGSSIGAAAEATGTSFIQRS